LDQVVLVDAEIETDSARKSRFRQIIVTDSVSLSAEDWLRNRGLKTVCLAPLLAEASRRF
jgi:phosphoribosylpyrophosphate synthetase